MPSLSRPELREMVRDAGLRATAPRIAVLQLLSKSQRPLSHSEVVEAVGHEEWDQATTYRNLVKLAESGLVRVASRIAGVVRYEFIHAGEGDHNHPHFACSACGTVTCLPGTQLSIAAEPNWQKAVQAGELQVVGLCPTCRSK